MTNEKNSTTTIVGVNPDPVVAPAPAQHCELHNVVTNFQRTDIFTDVETHVVTADCTGIVLSQYTQNYMTPTGLVVDSFFFFSAMIVASIALSHYTLKFLQRKPVDNKIHTKLPNE